MAEHYDDGIVEIRQILQNNFKMYQKQRLDVSKYLILTGW